MEILEKLLESGATVDFQDRVSKRAGIGWEAGGGPRLPLCVPTWDADRLPQGPGPTFSGLYGLGQAPSPPLQICLGLDGSQGFLCSA